MTAATGLTGRPCPTSTAGEASVKIVLKSAFPLVVSRIFRTFASMKKNIDNTPLSSDRREWYAIRPIVNEHDCDATQGDFSLIHPVNQRLTSLYKSRVIEAIAKSGKLSKYPDFFLRLDVRTDEETKRVTGIRIVAELSKYLTSTDNAKLVEDVNTTMTICEQATSVLSENGYPKSSLGVNVDTFMERLRGDVDGLMHYFAVKDADFMPEPEYVLVHEPSRRMLSTEGELTPDFGNVQTFPTFGDAMRRSVEIGSKFLTALRVYARGRTRSL